MIAREFGKRSGFHVAPVSIGAMRLPENLDEAVVLIRHAIDSGMTYIDTSRGYGDSEIKLGHALKDGYRQKVILSTKWSPWIVKVEDSDDTSADCMRRRIDESMQRLQVDYLDYFQLWNIMSRECYDAATATGGMLEGIMKARDEGLVGHIGFTTHDSPENLLAYLPEADWCEIVLFTCNLLNTHYLDTVRAYHDAGIGTIIMNPVGGGKLREASAVLSDLAARTGAVSVPDLALRFLLSHPFIDTLIPGITCMADVDASVASAERPAFDADCMREIGEFLAGIAAQQHAFCTNCGYCKPCPQNIEIPAYMDMLFDERFWGFAESARARYRQMEGARPDACTRCGECVPKCTQNLAIPDELEQCVQLFAGE